MDLPNKKNNKKNKKKQQKQLFEFRERESRDYTLANERFVIC
jgi:hypothetical protein